MGKENRSNQSLGIILAIILATSSLILTGINTFILVFEAPSGDQIESQKSVIRVYLNDTYETDTNNRVLLNFTTKTFDINNDFNLENDQFISPKDGYFQFDLYLHIQSVAPSIELQMLKNGVLYSRGFYTLNDRWVSYSDIAYLTLGASVNFTLEFKGNLGEVIGATSGDRTHLTIEEL